MKITTAAALMTEGSTIRVSEGIKHRLDWI
jgi:hypothetical protein